ncbi:hypothetical protein T484DRAFT_1980261 [Baffinella frigidus]|nr:hypothetical protein T484DRAFT_1980261 [Cryptophyta sp. CCMP2293]
MECFVTERRVTSGAVPVQRSTLHPKPPTLNNTPSTTHPEPRSALSEAQRLQC